MSVIAIKFFCEFLDQNACFGTCGSPQWKGDNICDDENNNCGCEWDGGDCCGSNVNTNYCSACECLDPNAAGSRKKKHQNQNIPILND